MEVSPIDKSRQFRFGLQALQFLIWHGPLMTTAYPFLMGPMYWLEFIDVHLFGLLFFQPIILFGWYFGDWIPDVVKEIFGIWNEGWFFFWFHFAVISTGFKTDESAE